VCVFVCVCCERERQRDREIEREREREETATPCGQCCNYGDHVLQTTNQVTWSDRGYFLPSLKSKHEITCSYTFTESPFFFLKKKWLTWNLDYPWQIPRYSQKITRTMIRDHADLQSEQQDFLEKLLLMWALKAEWEVCGQRKRGGQKVWTGPTLPAPKTRNW
jgi:hypothetical protein